MSHPSVLVSPQGRVLAQSDIPEVSMLLLLVVSSSELLDPWSVAHELTACPVGTLMAVSQATCYLTLTQKGSQIPRELRG